MLMMLGISPELTQAAFRVSDSAVNVSTPLFPFYPLLIMYCQKYAKAAGVGTLCSMMLPYTLALLLVLTVVLYAYWGIGVPLGFRQRLCVSSSPLIFFGSCYESELCAHADGTFSALCGRQYPE